jgi:hypothetical protein
MLNRNALMLVAGAAFFALDASAASAQAKPPTSTRRIPVTKEAPGEVAPTVRVDTVFTERYRTDTLRLTGRTDTVMTTNTVVRVDSVTVMPAWLSQKFGGVYFGLAGGSSLPAANFNDSDHPGWRAEAMLGVDPVGSAFGLRLTGGYGRYEPHSYVATRLGNAQLMTGAVDLKLRALGFSPFGRRVSVYGIGGGTYNRFKNILETKGTQLSIGDNVTTNGTLPTNDNQWHQGFGWNAGAGAEFGWGRTNLFVESRYSRFKGEQTNIAHLPLMVGLTFY